MNTPHYPSTSMQRPSFLTLEARILVWIVSAVSSLYFTGSFHKLTFSLFKSPFGELGDGFLEFAEYGFYLIVFIFLFCLISTLLRILTVTITLKIVQRIF